MDSGFDTTSTTEDVLAGVNLQGKRVFITGVSAGLGIETARAFAAHGAKVVGAARDLNKARSATAEVRQGAAAGSGSLELIELDLASLKSVRACADELNRRGQHFDFVIANAGVMATPFGHTADGFEMQFGTNHLGHFALVNRIAGLLKPGARLVTLSSSGHRFANVDLDDPNFERSEYAPFVAYGRSKTANVLFATAFDQRHRAKGIRATAVLRGGILSVLARHLDPAMIDQSMQQMKAEAGAKGEGAFVFKSVPQGAATSVWAAVVADADAIGGRYCENCHVSEVVPDERQLGMMDEGVRGYALDPANASALWSLSERMVGETFA